MKMSADVRNCASQLSEEVGLEYASSLADLTVNSKPLINMLTILAEENAEHAAVIIKVIEKHLEKVTFCFLAFLILPVGCVLVPHVPPPRPPRSTGTFCSRNLMQYMVRQLLSRWVEVREAEGPGVLMVGHGADPAGAANRQQLLGLFIDCCRTVPPHPQVVPEMKLPVLYLVDSIVKNVGAAYTALFTQNIVSTFCSVFEKVFLNSTAHVPTSVIHPLASSNATRKTSGRGAVSGPESCVKLLETNKWKRTQSGPHVIARFVCKPKKRSLVSFGHCCILFLVPLLYSHYFYRPPEHKKESGASEKEGEEVVEEVANPNCAKHCVCLVVSSRWPASIVEALRRHIGEYTGVDGNAENDASADDLSCQ